MSIAWTQKPPLAWQQIAPRWRSGLVAVWAFNEGGGSVSGTGPNGENYIFAPINAPAWTSGKYGAQIVFNGTNYLFCNTIITELPGASNASIFALGNALSTNNWSVGKLYSSSTRFGITTSGGISYFYAENGGNTNNYCSAPPSGDFSIGLSYDGTQSVPANRVAGYINGVPQSMTSVGTLPSTLSSTGTVTLIGLDNSGSLFQQGSTGLFVLWTGRTLTASEHSVLHNNPLALWSPAPHKTYWRGAPPYIYSTSGLSISGVLGGEGSSLTVPFSGLGLTTSGGILKGGPSPSATALPITGYVGSITTRNIAGTIYYYDLFSGSAGTPLTSHTTDSGATWPNDGNHVAGTGQAQLDGNGMIFNSGGTAANLTSATLPGTQNFEVLFSIEKLTTINLIATGIVLLCTTPFSNFPDHWEYLWVDTIGFTWHHNGTSVGTPAEPGWPDATLWYIKLDVITSGTDTIFSAYKSTTSINGPWSLLNSYTTTTPSNPIAIGPLFLGAPCTQTTGTHIGSLYVLDIAGYNYLTSGLQVLGTLGAAIENTITFVVGISLGDSIGATTEGLKALQAGLSIVGSVGGTLEGPSPAVFGLTVAVSPGSTTESLTRSAVGLTINSAPGGDQETLGSSVGGLTTTGLYGGTIEALNVLSGGLQVSGQPGVSNEAIGYTSNGLLIAGSISDISVSVGGAITLSIAGLTVSGSSGQAVDVTSTVAPGQLIANAIGGANEEVLTRLSGLSSVSVPGSIQIMVGGGAATILAVGIQIAGVVGITREGVSCNAIGSGISSNGSVTTEVITLDATGLSLNVSSGTMLTSKSALSIYPDPFRSTTISKTQNEFFATAKIKDEYDIRGIT